jgi:hypothetical protein
MTTSTSVTVRRTAISAVALGLMAAPVILMPTMASAIPVSDPSCGTATPAATLVAPGVCEVVFTESGTFTAPSTISKLAAFLVAGGEGGSIDSDFGSTYGGGAGEVVYIDAVEFSAPLAVSVGTGGYANDRGTATETTVGDATARPGDGVFSGNENYNPTSAPCINRESGAGAGAAGNGDGDTVGPGYLLSEFPGVDTALFPATDGEAIFAQGGDACLPALPTTVANSGNGGATTFAAANDGSDGIVIFRYATLSDEAGEEAQSGIAPAATVLAATGPSVSSAWAPGAASALFAAGAALLVMVRRSRKNA